MAWSEDQYLLYNNIPKDTEFWRFDKKSDKPLGRWKVIGASFKTGNIIVEQIDTGERLPISIIEAVSAHQRCLLKGLGPDTKFFD